MGNSLFETSTFLRNNSPHDEKKHAGKRDILEPETIKISFQSSVFGYHTKHSSKVGIIPHTVRIN